MKTIQINNTLIDVLKYGNINPEKALTEYAIIDLLNKKDKYEQDVRAYEQKYNSDFYAFELKIHSQKNTENFEIEDDLMDWEFAVKCLQDIDFHLKKVNLFDDDKK